MTNEALDSVETKSALDELEEKQQLFVHEYIKDLNGTKAAIRAHYAEDSAHVQASRMLSYAKVQNAIAELKAQRNKQLNVDDPFERNSLIERDKVELTGSDLCRKMLERGDKFVMCQTASGVDVISGTYEDGFFVSISNEYEDVTPINNQGEPLTAAEVGL